MCIRLALHFYAVNRVGEKKYGLFDEMTLLVLNGRIVRSPSQGWHSMEVEV
jgi:hypothetical protein